MAGIEAAGERGILSQGICLVLLHGVSGTALPTLLRVGPPVPPTGVSRFLAGPLSHLLALTLSASVTLVFPARPPAPAPLQAQRPTQPLRHLTMGPSLAVTPWMPHLSSLALCSHALSALPVHPLGAGCLLLPGLGPLAVCRACHSVTHHVSRKGL